MHRDTLILNAGYRRTDEPGSMMSGPEFVSTYVAPGDPAQHRLTYGRFDNPTWSHWEEALGELEGGQAVSFASGMAAVSAVLGACLRPGDAVVLPAESYYTVRTLASTPSSQRRLRASSAQASKSAFTGTLNVLLLLAS